MVDVLNASTGRKERVGRLLEMHANHREERDAIGAGEIVAVVIAFGIGWLLSSLPPATQRPARIRSATSAPGPGASCQRFSSMPSHGSARSAPTRPSAVIATLITFSAFTAPPPAVETAVPIELIALLEDVIDRLDDAAADGGRDHGPAAGADAQCSSGL